MVATTASGGINAVEVRVKGIFETATKSYDDYAIRLPLKVAQALLRVSGVHMWLVLLHRTVHHPSQERESGGSRVFASGVKQRPG